METTYTVGELKSLIREASSNQEFEPKLGPEVESKNKEINDKAYKDAEKISQEHYGMKLKAPEISKYEKHDWNKTPLDADFDFEPSKEWKKEQEAHAEGFTSDDEKNNGIEKTGDRENNKEFYKVSKETDDKSKRNKEIMKTVGIRGNHIYHRPGGKEYFQSHGGYTNENRTPVRTICENAKSGKYTLREAAIALYQNGYFKYVPNENQVKQVIAKVIPLQEKKETGEKKIKTVVFKKTTFLTEGHMISRIPDEFKNEGCTFRMKDKTGNEYLIEWSDNRANILEHEDKQKFNESIDRMKSLFNYNSGEYFKNTTGSERLNESNEGFTKTLDSARKIIK